MTGEDESYETTRRPWRGAVLATALGALLIVGYFATGMPGMNRDRSSGSGSMASMESMDQSAARFTRLAPDAFAARMSRPSALVINVHTPYAGELDGTDQFIPFDKIAGDSRLPTDKNAEILLYCRSGRMSRIAAERLVAGGYTNVVDLEGGMDAWKAAGMPVRSDPSRGG